MIQSFNIKLERITERGYLKLFPLLSYNKLYTSEVMDVRVGRSIY